MHDADAFFRLANDRECGKQQQPSVPTTQGAWIMSEEDPPGFWGRFRSPSVMGPSYCSTGSECGLLATLCSRILTLQQQGV
mmetsp:Transcript_15611/g.27711  ORF Transcript_15611/g.27711 Transcript_15611/m.27711 type:complete len:81 (-) Transcript_15611:191-433(-)